jgi:hypothetical protein
MWAQKAVVTVLALTAARSQNAIPKAVALGDGFPMTVVKTAVEEITCTYPGKFYWPVLSSDLGKFGFVESSTGPGLSKSLKRLHSVRMGLRASILSQMPDCTIPDPPVFCQSQ